MQNRQGASLRAKVSALTTSFLHGHNHEQHEIFHMNLRLQCLDMSMHLCTELVQYVQPGQHTFAFCHLLLMQRTGAPALIVQLAVAAFAYID
jgi:hypothetical protein